MEGSYSNSCYHDLLKLELEVECTRKKVCKPSSYLFDFDKIDPSKFQYGLTKAKENFEKAKALIQTLLKSEKEKAAVLTDFFYFFLVDQVCGIVPLRKKKTKRKKRFKTKMSGH